MAHPLEFYPWLGGLTRGVVGVVVLKGPPLDRWAGVDTGVVGVVILRGPPLAGWTDVDVVGVAVQSGLTRL